MTENVHLHHESGRGKSFSLITEKPSRRSVNILDRSKIVVIGLTLLFLALTCSAVDLRGSAGKAALSNITGAPSNSTNSTLNSTNMTLNLSNTTRNLSDLWSWGNVPAGYTKIGNKIIPGPSAEPNESVMETPSQLMPENSKVNDAGGLLVTPK